MSFLSVKAYIEKFGLAERITHYETSTATVALAAIAAGVTEGQIAKTMSFILKDSSPVLVVMAGDVKTDNAKFKAFFSSKAKMMDIEQLSRYTGHQKGGVCPFALIDSKVKVYLDESLKRFDFVYPAAGDDASAVKLTIDELYRLSNAVSWVDVAKTV